jgi:hypothetical protein
MGPFTRLLGWAAATASLAVARCCLWLAPGPIVRWATTRGDGPGRGSSADAMARAVAGVGTRLRASCLEQAVALVIILAALRQSGRLMIGVASAVPQLRAHAWVECGGRIVLGAAQASAYHPFPVVAPVCRP